MMMMVAAAAAAGVGGGRGAGGGVLPAAADVSGAPVAVEEAPGAVDADGGPGVAEPASFQLHARLVARAFGVPFDDLAVQTGVAVGDTVYDVGARACTPTHAHARAHTNAQAHT